jgi:hypothetical protein
MYRGNFDIRDTVLQQIPLDRWSVAGNCIRLWADAGPT